MICVRSVDCICCVIPGSVVSVWCFVIRGFKSSVVFVVPHRFALSNGTECPCPWKLPQKGKKHKLFEGQEAEVWLCLEGPKPKFGLAQKGRKLKFSFGRANNISLACHRRARSTSLACHSRARSTSLKGKKHKLGFA